MHRHLIALVAALSLILCAPFMGHAQSTDTALTPRTFIDVSKNVLPAVVSIEVTVPISERLQKDYNVQNMEEFMRKLMEDQQTLRNFPFPDYGNEDFGSRGSGSGVVVSKKDGWAYVVTNRHVVGTNQRTTYAITLDPSYPDSPVKIEGKDVEWVGDDSLSDIAVIRFRIPQGTEVAALEFGDSDSVEVGEWVLALGNPLDLGNSVSQGIISAKNRSVGAMSSSAEMTNRFDNHLQTTAVINPGNSGGPLVNLEGKIVGINNAIATETGRWAGIGFAIPSNTARSVAEQLISGGKVSRGYLGIAMRDVSDIRSSAFSRKLKDGVSVEEVRPDTPAQAAGLLRGDVVYAVDDHRVRNSAELLETIATRNAGDTVNLKVHRYADANATDSKDMQFAVQLMERPTEMQLAESLQKDAPRNPDWFAPLVPQPGAPGAQPDPNQPLLIDPNQPSGKEFFRGSEDRATLGLTVAPSESAADKGMVIKDVQKGSAADRAGLRAGDIVLQINGLETASSDEFYRALSNVEAGSDHVVVYLRDGEKRTATVESSRR